MKGRVEKLLERKDKIGYKVAMGKLTLAINTASSQTSIALFEGENLLTEKSWTSKNDEAEKIMPAIKKLLKKNKFSEIGKVIVVKGPGSFTGLRIGVTVANTISYLNKCEIFGIDTCEYLWALLEDSQLENLELKNLALLVFAGSKGVYVSQNIEPATKASLVNIPDLTDYLKAHGITKFFGDISKEQKNILEEFEYLEIKKSFGEIMQKILAKIGQGILKPVPIVEPIYVKKPAITESKKNIFA